tara:strand:- start:62 stop:1888 length:1827 start_codon:yes stop_codon:yes gene_type:complete
MADFKTRINDLTGFASTDDTALNDWLSSGARSVINILPINKLERVAGNENFTNTIDVEGKKILAVVRKDNNHTSKIYTPCRKLPPSMMGRVNDTNYMEAASESDPAYIIQNQLLNTYPGSNTSNDSRVVFINSSITVAHGDSSIVNFPDEAEEAVVLYASRNALLRLQNNMNAISSLTVSVSAPSAPSVSTVSYSAASNADASASSVGAITVASVSKADISGDVPTYSKPSVSLTSNLSISDLSISSSAPSAPGLGTVSYSAATNADASASAVSAITVATVAKADISGDVPTYTKPSQSFDIAQFETFLETNEDVELAQLQLGRLNNELAEYQADIQNELNDFNEKNAKYRANVEAELAKHNSDLRKAITQAELDARDAQQEAAQTTDVDKFNKAQDQALALQNAAQTMQATIQNNDDLVSKFVSELRLYEQNINKEVTLYRANYEKDFAIFSKQRDTELQNYSLDIQNELNEFNKENVRYQANVQAEIQKHQSDLQKALNQANIDAADARQEAQQATQVDLANKAADQALALQNAAQTMAAAIQNNDDILIKFRTEIQKYAAQVSDEVQEFNSNLQKDIAKYSWYEKQYAIVDARYKEQIQTLQGAL